MPKKIKLYNLVKDALLESIKEHGYDVLIENDNNIKTLDDLYNEYNNCMKCSLGSTRLNIVMGEGNTKASLMLIGEAPGFDEDHKAKPFIGKAGELLIKIINAIDLTRNDVYIISVVKCHHIADQSNPEKRGNDRRPNIDEINACKPILYKQIDIIKPKIICTLGDIASKALIKTDLNISEIRGKTFKYKNSIIVPTYHPAYLLRSPKNKKYVWEDMKKIRSLLKEK